MLGNYPARLTQELGCALKVEFLHKRAMYEAQLMTVLTQELRKLLKGVFMSNEICNLSVVAPQLMFSTLNQEDVLMPTGSLILMRACLQSISILMGHTLSNQASQTS